MDVFDLSSQEEFSPLKPLTKRARRILTPAEDKVPTNSVTRGEKEPYPAPAEDKVATNFVTTDEKEPSPKLSSATLNSQSEGVYNASQQREDVNELCPPKHDTTVSSKVLSDPDKQKRPVYIYSPELIRRCDAMPKIINRVYHTYSLSCMYEHDLYTGIRIHVFTCLYTSVRIHVCKSGITELKKTFRKLNSIYWMS